MNLHDAIKGKSFFLLSLSTWRTPTYQKKCDLPLYTGTTVPKRTKIGNKDILRRYQLCLFFKFGFSPLFNRIWITSGRQFVRLRNNSTNRNGWLTRRRSCCNWRCIQGSSYITVHYAFYCCSTKRLCHIYVYMYVLYIFGHGNMISNQDQDYFNELSQFQPIILVFGYCLFLLLSQHTEKAFAPNIISYLNYKYI